ncbi:MAG TPA: urate hydroxylase PuuD [Gemmatimonadales bacterium]|nr:urate hydroxylase PuuD [Gemmatimonadales bacterium]
MQILTSDGVEFLLRWVHFLAGITWIGLLYYFNFVQGPFFAEADAATRSAATQKLVPRALWWFRWGAMLTFLSGALIILKRFGEAPAGTSVATSPWGVAILTGALFGTLMFLNVWLVIWPKQKVVIANAVATAGGAPANPAAAGAARRAFLTSRTNVVFSVPMLFFMGAASHFAPRVSGNLPLYWTLILVLAALVEINALTGDKGATTRPLETVRSVIISGFAFWAVIYAVVTTVLR